MISGHGTNLSQVQILVHAVLRRSYLRYELAYLIILLIKFPYLCCVSSKNAIETLAGANADVIDKADFSSLSEWGAWDMNDRKMQSELHLEEAIEGYVNTLAVNPKSLHTLEYIMDSAQKLARRRVFIPKC